MTGFERLLYRVAFVITLFICFKLLVLAAYNQGWWTP